MKKVIVLAIICCFLSACSFYRVDNEKRLSGNTERAEEQVEIHNGEEEHEEEPFSGTDTFSESVNTLQQQLYLEGEQAIDFRITMIGDSLTEGVGDQTNNGGYRYFLSKELLEESGIDQVQFGAFGKNGLTSAGLKKRLKEEQIIESVQNADIVIITIGGNDVMNVVKKNFMNLQVGDFYKAMDKYEANIKNKNGKFYSTKASDRGFGLMSIDNIVKRYKGYVNRQYDESIFATEVLLPL